MSIITKFLAVVTEPKFKLARDLTAMAIADGEVTTEEKEAISAICHLEGVDESKLMDALRGGYDKVREEMPNSRQEKEVYLRDIIKLIGADGYSAPQEVYLFQIIASSRPSTSVASVCQRWQMMPLVIACRLSNSCDEEVMLVLL